MIKFTRQESNRKILFYFRTIAPKNLNREKIKEILAFQCSKYHELIKKYSESENVKISINYSWILLKLWSSTTLTQSMATIEKPLNLQ